MTEEVAASGASPVARPVDGLHTRALELRAALSDTSTILVALITLFALGIRLFRLNDIPAEMWGDVITHYQLAQRVMDGNYFLDYEFGGDGPLFSYLVAGLAAIFGLSFTTIKLATVLVGTAVVPVVYFLGRELFDSRRIGLVGAFLTAVSFWDITFSRQGKPYILVALFVGLAVLFAVRKQPIAAGIVLGLGMYTQAAFWGAPLAFLVAPWALLVAIEVAIPFIYLFARNPGALIGSSSYVGEKLHANLTPLQIVQHVLENIWKNALSFNVRGDTTFRHNIPGHPHLDLLTGLLFLLGMGLVLERIVRRRDYRLLWWLVVPFLVVQIPSVLDMHPENVPAMGRMVGVIPFVFLSAAYAVEWLGAGGTRLLSGHVSAPSRVAWASLGVLLAAIAFINLRNYFVIYPQTLPNNNTPFDGIIAQQINSSAPSTYSIVVSCCWGDWGQPEPGAIQYRVNPGHPLLMAPAASNLPQILHRVPGRARVLIYGAPQETTAGSMKGLRSQRGHMLRRNGWDVAWVIAGQRS